MKSYTHPFSPPLPLSKPILPAGVPDRAAERVKASLDTLWFTRCRMDECRALDERMGAGGRYEAQLLIKHQPECDAAQGYLNRFRTLAAERGIDALAVITALGGLPDLEPSPKDAAYLSGIKGV
jgi:hypothetical protein